jgi:hypothetical protein
MHPYMLEGVARERIADWHRAAAAHRLVSEADRDVRAPRARWIGGRRHHGVELVWPDGVSSVVELPRSAMSARNEGRGLAGSRR